MIYNKEQKNKKEKKLQINPSHSEIKGSNIAQRLLNEFPREILIHTAKHLQMKHGNEETNPYWFLILKRNDDNNTKYEKYILYNNDKKPFNLNEKIINKLNIPINEDDEINIISFQDKNTLDKYLKRFGHKKIIEICYDK